jgi:hypothetical protein
MNDKLKINGIRLNKDFIQLTQERISGTGDMSVPLYQILDASRINMVFMALNTIGRPFISGTIASKHFGQLSLQTDISACHPTVCTVSIYPHHYRLRLLGFFLSLIGRQKVFFRYLMSSGSMLTLVVDQKNCDSLIHLLSEEFDLPRSHVPFEQGENEELTRFLKKKFPETRANYVEKKIKTYGITIVPDLILGYYMFSFDLLAEYGKKMKDMEDKKDTFSYLSAHMTASLQTHLFLLSKKLLDIPARETCPADLLTFHGPHFGDRHSIVSRALNCLAENFIPVLQVGCTGASISIVLPRGNGKSAKQALMNVFEAP